MDVHNKGSSNQCGFGVLSLRFSPILYWKLTRTEGTDLHFLSGYLGLGTRPESGAFLDDFCFLSLKSRRKALNSRIQSLFMIWLNWKGSLSTLSNAQKLPVHQRVRTRPGNMNMQIQALGRHDETWEKALFKIIIVFKAPGQLLSFRSRLGIIHSSVLKDS